jgi:hypothetical protein
VEKQYTPTEEDNDGAANVTQEVKRTIQEKGQPDTGRINKTKQTNKISFQYKIICRRLGGSKYITIFAAYF